MIYSVVSSLILLALCPFVVGNVLSLGLSEDFQKNYAFKYVIGFMGMNAIWWFFAFPYNLFFTMYPFSKLCEIYFLVIGIVFVFQIVLWIKNVDGFWRMVESFKWRNIFSCIKNRKKTWYDWGFFGILAYQLFRMIFYARQNYATDDCAYITYINDIVYTDLALKKHPTGYLIGAGGQNMKMICTGWYEFLAMFSKVTDIHPLFVCKTLMPIVLLTVYYATMYSMFCEIWINNSDKVSKAMFSVSFITESLRYVCILFFMLLCGTIWGKFVVGTIIAPLIVLLFSKAMKESRYNNYFIMMGILGAASASFSSASTFTITIILGIEVLVYLFRNKNGKPIAIGLSGLAPILLQGVVYIVGYR